MKPKAQAQPRKNRLRFQSLSCSQNSSQVQEYGKRKKSSLDNVVDDPDDPDEVILLIGFKI